MALKSFDIDKSQTIACTIFPQAKHKIRYRLLVYSSQAVSKASALKRTWRGKIVTYLATEHALIFEYGNNNEEPRLQGAKRFLRRRGCFPVSMWRPSTPNADLARALPEKLHTNSPFLSRSYQL
ncbi:hypothetical protein PC113_g18023 [Phytophthora cactorum]|uniref:Uncharacterized protein n=2 Tax=Phytophthora cactorum TaxID=29920 RepID=A0A8T0YRQ1_9STRA|nr:hypothetical protein PC113_g18023 [Phytophthora cactorum]